MRKFSKVALIFAAVVGVAGTGMTIGGAAMGATIAGLNIGKYGLGKTVNKAMISTESAKNWDMDWDEINAAAAGIGMATQMVPSFIRQSTASSLDILPQCGSAGPSVNMTSREIWSRGYRKQEKIKVRVGQEGEDALVIEATRT